MLDIELLIRATYINPRYPKGGPQRPTLFLIRNNFFLKSFLENSNTEKNSNPYDIYIYIQFMSLCIIFSIVVMSWVVIF